MKWMVPLCRRRQFLVSSYHRPRPVLGAEARTGRSARPEFGQVDATSNGHHKDARELFWVQESTGTGASTVTVLTAILTATRTNTGGLWRTRPVSAGEILNSTEPLADDHERARGDLKRSGALNPGAAYRIA